MLQLMMDNVFNLQFLLDQMNCQINQNKKREVSSKSEI